MKRSQSSSTHLCGRSRPADCKYVSSSSNLGRFSSTLYATSLFSHFQAATSIMEFKFNKKRARILSKASEFPEWGQGVIYWMFREQRVQGEGSGTPLTRHVLAKYFMTLYRERSVQIIGLYFTLRNWLSRTRFRYTFAFVD